MANVPSATAVVSTGREPDVVATTVNAFTSLSLEPPLILICLALTSRTREAVLSQRQFGVNVLAETQLSAARLCARLDKEPGGLGVEWSDGYPLFRESVATLSCRVADEFPGGDHTIIVGLVEACWAEADRTPLIFHRGSFWGPPSGPLAEQVHTRAKERR